MLDLTTETGRIIAAALRLAESRDWNEISLLDIAREAGLTLTELSAQFSNKAQILAAFSRHVDAEVLRRTGTSLSREDGPRERLMEVVMTRLDVLQPYKAALKRIVASAPAGLGFTRPDAVLRSQRWMLEAAGISTEQPGAMLRIGGLACIYGDVLRIWLEDDEPGLSRTMAALDRRLRSGERALTTIDDICDGIGRIGKAICGLGRRQARHEGAARAPAPPQDAGEAPPRPAI